MVRDMAVSLARKLWTIDKYEQMIEKGILDEDDRVELVGGEIVETAPIGIRHAACVIALEELFRELLGKTVTVSGQNPVRLPNNSEPEADVALLKGPRKLYTRRRPTVGDVLLLVEVSDTTRGTDRGVKVPLYAEAGIPQVWIVNLDEDLIEVYSEPAGGQYRRASRVGRGGMLALPDGLEGSISVDEVWG